jgi:hypothetical protein
MQARGFDGELRYLPGSPVARTSIAVGLTAIGLLIAFELAAHGWLPRL